MKPTRNPRALARTLLSIVALASPLSMAHAAVYTKADNASNLNLEGSWVEGIVPGAADIALWNNTVTGVNAPSLGANTIWQGLQITDPGGTVRITGARSLTLGASGINASTATVTLQLQNDTTILGAAQTWDFGSGGSLNIQNALVDNAGHTLTINSTNAAKTLSTISDITGAGGLSITGGGVFEIGASTTYSGTTAIENGSTLSLGRTGSVGSISSASHITSSSAGTLRLARSNDFEVANTISGDITAQSLGAGTTTLSGANTFTGKTLIFLGGIKASSLNSVGDNRVASSSLGAPTNASNGMIGIGFSSFSAQLTYTGSGETTDRIIQLRGSTGGAILDQSGSGLLKFTSPIQANAGAKTLTLQGSTSGVGEMAGAVIDDAGTVSVAKSGTSTWILSGNNSYTGGTIVNEGTLLINTPAVAGNSGTGDGSVTVNGGVLGGTGIIAPGGANAVSLANGAVLAPGDSTSGSGLGTLVFDGSDTSATLLTLQSGAGLSFQLGNVLGSDAINFWNYNEGVDLVLNANVIDIGWVTGAAPGTYTLFNFYSGNGTGLTASGLSGGLTVNFLNGGSGTLDFSTVGQINLVVASVPEPGTLALLAGAGVVVLWRRRRA